MATRNVQASAVSAAPPSQVWASVSDFCAPWHPMVEDMQRETDSAGRLIRAFTVADEQTLYRERLTYLSHSERRMNYTHLEGIAGATRYDASLVVTAHKGGSLITMQAQIEAPEPRCQEIADGTQWVFDTGVESLAFQVRARENRPLVWAPPEVPLTHVMLEKPPRLGLTVTPEGSDTLVLFLHGIGGNRDNWLSELHSVAPHARAASLDLRGYGDSALGDTPSRVDDYCADILRVKDALGAKDLILCGLSYGAWIATSFAMRHPEQLRGLVLSGGCTGMSEASTSERDAFRQSREVPLDAGQTPADFAPAVVDVIAGPDATAAVRAALHASMAAIPVETYRDALRCFTNPAEVFDFSKITCPVLMMTGAHDRLAPPAEIRSVADRIWSATATPDVQFEVIEGAGHLCNLENPSGYYDALVPFIQRITR